MPYHNIYDINFSQDTINKTISRLTNQLWKLIPMREKEENWSKQLETVKLEIVGLNNIFMGVVYLELLAKLEGIASDSEMSFDLYRKTVFECISLLQELKK